MSEKADLAEAVELADYLAQKREAELRTQKESDDYLIESLRGDVARLERELAEAREAMRVTVRAEGIQNTKLERTEAALAALREQRCETGVLAEIKAERQRQDAKWGEQNHDPFTYLAILTEEVGEAAQAAVQARFEDGSPFRYRKELIQVAAVAVAMVECVDRGLWAWARREP